jgi:hypothetical protein
MAGMVTGSILTKRCLSPHPLDGYLKQIGERGGMGEYK